MENPATREILCKVHSAQYIDVEHAINCAENAFKNGDWYQNMDVRDRSHILLKCAKKLQKSGTTFRLTSIPISNRNVSLT